MRDTDTNPKLQSGSAEKILAREIRQELKENLTTLEDLQRAIKLLQARRERLLELLHRITIADEPTPTIGIGSQTKISAVRPGGLLDRVNEELEKGKL